MSDTYVGADNFAASLEDILSGINEELRIGVDKAVDEGLKVGARAWRKNARAQFSGDYFKSGHWYTAGAYAKSIRKRKYSSGDKPAGEIGSPSMPGLPHLLEKGHARVGGGRVEGRIHILPAAEEAFDATERAIDDAVDKALG